MRPRFSQTHFPSSFSSLLYIPAANEWAQYLTRLAGELLPRQHLAPFSWDFVGASGICFIWIPCFLRKLHWFYPSFEGKQKQKKFYRNRPVTFADPEAIRFIVCSFFFINLLSTLLLRKSCWDFCLPHFVRYRNYFSQSQVPHASMFFPPIGSVHQVGSSN